MDESRLRSFLAFLVTTLSFLFSLPRRDNGWPVEVLPSLDDQIPVDCADSDYW